jgi:hypothetical protein
MSIVLIEKNWKTLGEPYIFMDFSLPYSDHSFNEWGVFRQYNNIPQEYWSVHDTDSFYNMYDGCHFE